MGPGTKVRVGENPWVGCDEHFRLPQEMVVSLRNRGIFHLSQINDRIRSNWMRQHWLEADRFDFEGEQMQAWNNYCNALLQSC